MKILSVKKPTLVLTGGGTAGHVWPHFAIASETNAKISTLVAQDKLQILYFGSKTGMERKIIESNSPHWHYIPISTGKLRRYFSWKNLVDPFLVFAGFVKTFFYLLRFRNSVLFSKGGFVSAPVVWAAWLCRIPVVIHESDLSPALATKLSLPFADRILFSFEKTEKYISKKYIKNVVTTGIPLRASLFAASREAGVAHFGLEAQKRTILIFGGSLGADALNKRMAEAITLLGKLYNIIHIVGKGKQIPIEAGPCYRQFEFLTDDMCLAYAVSDLVICRAGASSIFELAAARIPMVLVPLGLHQSRGDQIENAKVFAEKGWAQIVWEEELTTEKIMFVIEETMNSLPDKKKMLQNAPTADAAEKVASILLSFLKFE